MEENVAIKDKKGLKECGCPKNKKKKDKNNLMAKTSTLQTFDRIEWLKKRVLSSKLADRTVRLKYLKHASEMNEYFATKRVFDRFDDDHNSKCVFCKEFE